MRSQQTLEEAEEDNAINNNNNNKTLPLLNKWIFAFDDKPNKNIRSNGSLLQQGQVLGNFDTVQSFWGCWNNIHINKLPEQSSLKLYKQNLNFNELDEAGGGKWVITCDKRENTTQHWLMCVLALIGEQFEGDHHCGSVLSIGKRSNTLMIITKSSDKRVNSKTEEAISVFLQIEREKIKWQSNGTGAACASTGKGPKSWSIKLTKSADLTNVKLPVPLIKEEEEEEENGGTYIDLKKEDFNVSDLLECPPPSTTTATVTTNSYTLSLPNGSASASSSMPTTPTILSPSKGSGRGLAPSFKSKSLSSSTSSISTQAQPGPTIRLTKDSPVSSHRAPVQSTHSRLAQSIDSASFRMWRITASANNGNYLKPNYTLPKLYRRRGRRASNDKALSVSPSKRSANPPSVPETIPENKPIELTTNQLKPNRKSKSKPQAQQPPAVIIEQPSPISTTNVTSSSASLLIRLFALCGLLLAFALYFLSLNSSPPNSKKVIQ